MRTAFLACALLLCAAGHAAGPWTAQLLPGATVFTIGSADARQVQRLAEPVGRAVAELHALPGFSMCQSPQIFIHPDLESFTSTTGLPWFVLAAADRTACRLDLQRLLIVEQHSGVVRTLRHELFHLAQPAGWERWRAEGEAMRFAGESPTLAPLPGLSPAQLDGLLRAAPDQDTQERAAATALQWVLQGR